MRRRHHSEFLRPTSWPTLETAFLASERRPTYHTHFSFLLLKIQPRHKTKERTKKTNQRRQKTKKKIQNEEILLSFNFFFGATRATINDSLSFSSIPTDVLSKRPIWRFLVMNWSYMSRRFRC